MERNEWNQKDRFSFSDLIQIVSVLRSPDGCPWDREQNHKSLRNNFVEEAYEVCEGIDKEDNALLCEELGDVLLHIVFHSGIAQEEGAFSLDDVINGICKKMINRHPHVFGEIKESEFDWEEIKRKEKGEQTLSQTLRRISTSLPALKRAEKFIKQNAPKAETEKDPLLIKGKDFYELCEHCRKENIDPEEALNAYLNKVLKKCTKYE